MCQNIVKLCHLTECLCAVIILITDDLSMLWDLSIHLLAHHLVTSSDIIYIV